MREIVFDTETTGLNPHSGDRMVEIGCVEIFNRVETGRHYHCYFNPGRDMPFEAEAVHGLARERVVREGVAHDWVALHMLTALRDVTLYASAPSWDGQWLSRLLRAAGLPRHALRLKATAEAQRRVILDVLAAGGTIRVGGTVAGDVRAAGGQVIVAGSVGEDGVLTGGQVELAAGETLFVRS